MHIYTVYLTINNINEHFYYGVHKTKTPNDKYLGSGKLLKDAIQKYGIKNFSKHILFEFDNKQDAYDMETILVTNKTVTNRNCYNIKLGGIGGFDAAYNSEGYKVRNIKVKQSHAYRVISRITTNCITCDREILHKINDNRKFCSRSCSATYSNKNRTIRSTGSGSIKFNCDYCGELNTKDSSEYRSHSTHFCNKSCSMKFKHQQNGLRSR